MLLYPPGLEFIGAFLGCLYAGVVAVPAHPPRSKKDLPLWLTIVRDAQPSVILTTTRSLSRFKAWTSSIPETSGLNWLATDEPGEVSADDWREPALQGDAVAFLQYTSGSTSDPKGVVVSHRNLLSNEEMIRRAFSQTADSIIVGWLPLFHDMGLIGTILQPLYVGAHSILMSPLAFLAKPVRWLRAMTRYRATTSGGPSFAYDLCVRRIGADQREELDLSSWRVAFNGAEPVRASVMEQFAEAFGPCGFRREAFFPCYGLAEATLFVTGGSVDTAPRVEAFEAEALEDHRVVPAEDATGEAASEDTAAGRRLVSCGWAHSGREDGQVVLCVDPVSRERCAPDQIGEIWIAGPGVAHGYWRRPEISQRDFSARLADDPAAGPFLRTGDLGFLHREELFVTGRLKDLIILRGRNHYPQDFELTAERADPALRSGCGAAFSIDVEDQERLVIAWEIDRRSEDSADRAAEALRRAVSETHQVQVYDVIVVRAGTVPKTSSGKIQRQRCRARYLRGELEPLGARESTPTSSPVPVPPADSAALGSMAAALACLEPDRRREALLGFLRRELESALRRPIADSDLRVPLTAHGLDSMAAAHLKHRIEEVLAVEVSFSDLLGDGHILDLADLLLEALGDAEAGNVPALRASALREFAIKPSEGESGTGEPLPLSFGQRRLWFLQQLDASSPAYNLPGAVRIGGSLERRFLEAGFAEVIRRHEPLRTTFRIVDSEPVQVVAPFVRWAMPVVDLSRLGAVQSECVAERLAELEARRPFDLAAGPVLRGMLLALGEEDHILVLNVHHISSDGRSMTRLAEEVSAHYRASTAAPPRPPELDDPVLSYADYTRWQRARWPAVRDQQLAYWQQQLAGAPAALELPVDRAQRPPGALRGAVASRSLPISLSAQIHALGRRAAVTPYMVLTSVLALLLSRYTGGEDLVIGSPISGRRPEIDSLIGFFVNTFALRIDLSGAPSSQELLQRVRRVAVEAYAHQELPFEKLIEHLDIDRSVGRSPLFQVMLAPRLRPEASFDLGPANIEPLEVSTGTSRFDLTVLVETDPAEGGEPQLTLHFEYPRDLFDAVTIQRLAGHFERLLGEFVLDDERSLEELVMLSAGERHQLQLEWNDSGTSELTAGCIHELFEAWAKKTPDAPALVAAGLTLSYGEVDRRAERVASRLRPLGVGSETPVAICAQRSAELVVGILGILKAGGFFIPLDPKYPSARLRFMVRDSGAAILLGQPGVASAFDPLVADGLQILPLDGAGDDESFAPDALASGLASRELRRSQARPSNLAYAIYTSGSTGRPKGVAIGHRSLLQLVRWHREVYEIQPSDRATLVASPAFDASVWEIWPYLSAGASLHIPGEEERGAPQDLVRWLAAEGITVSFLPTPLAELALAQPWPPESRLRALLTGGDRLRRRPSQELDFAVVNHYGPTENTVVATCGTVSAKARHGALPPIGRPIPHTRIHLLDRHLRPVPVGVAGEIYIGGGNLSRGYFLQPGQTAGRFLPDPFARNPFAHNPGGRLYKTGDRGRLLPDGRLDFLGRTDHQVKVRGFRIELGEIEAVLNQLEGVGQAAAVTFCPQASDDSYLVAYLVPEVPGDTEDLVETAEGHLRERLPEYMVPTAFVTLDALPLDPNGKLDRRALPEPQGHAQTFEPPSTPLEKDLARLWAEVLGVERVGLYDNFFQLGGHSLKATQLLSRVREDFAAEIPLHEFFETPHIAGMARHLEERRREPHTDSSPPPLKIARLPRGKGGVEQLLDRARQASNDPAAKTTESAPPKPMRKPR